MAENFLRIVSLNLDWFETSPKVFSPSSRSRFAASLFTWQQSSIALRYKESSSGGSRKWLVSTNWATSSCPSMDFVIRKSSERDVAIMLDSGSKLSAMTLQFELLSVRWCNQIPLKLALPRQALKITFKAEFPDRAKCKLPREASSGIDCSINW